MPSTMHRRLHEALTSEQTKKLKVCDSMDYVEETVQKTSTEAALAVKELELARRKIEQLKKQNPNVSRLVETLVVPQLMMIVIADLLGYYDGVVNHMQFGLARENIGSETDGNGGMTLTTGGKEKEHWTGGERPNTEEWRWSKDSGTPGQRKQGTQPPIQTGPPSGHLGTGTDAVRFQLRPKGRYAEALTRLDMKRFKPCRTTYTELSLAPHQAAPTRACH
ncbi:hypothetical protein WN55_08861 [Dufourea novaeangliae]|uniref:Uncharacterized protein n=1 Tax=Dufourea novaeangliae TaxID=178035 RepID=A0A154P1N6_DUFNO|nr:hypothetical protein WN55_08861 [Dufourea novaeangliae]